MSRSPRRATARIDCRARLCQTPFADEKVGAWHRAPPHQLAVLLRAAFEKESIQQQQDHGADDRHDPAGDIILARKDATNPSPDQCAGDAEQNRDDATAGISSPASAALRSHR